MVATLPTVPITHAQAGHRYEAGLGDGEAEVAGDVGEEGLGIIDVCDDHPDGDRHHPDGCF